MFSRWKERFEPWRVLDGWEFDLLRTLPPEVANRLYLRARKDAELRFMKSRQYWVVVWLIFVPAGASVGLIWVAGLALGLGFAGRLVFEIVFHVLIGWLILHPLIRMYERHLLPDTRTALAEELMRFARDELTPPHRA